MGGALGAQASLPAGLRKKPASFHRAVANQQAGMPALSGCSFRIGLVTIHRIQFIEIMNQRSIRSDISAAYDDWAETYDTVQNLTRDLASQALKQSDLNFAASTIIEVGCGTGRNTEWLAGHEAGAAEIVALDFSEEMLKRARDRVRDTRVRFVQQDVRDKWPVSNGTADLVVVMLVVEHLEHLEPIFAEAARTLKAGGEMLIVELHPTLQLMGKQARFTSAKTGESTLITAFLHRTEDYHHAAISTGFEVVRELDWYVPDEPTDTPPRLLSLRCRLR
jgi:ubiquinone/menaquinone biosynthesis C-methylase UbiE